MLLCVAVFVDVRFAPCVVVVVACWLMVWRPFVLLLDGCCCVFVRCGGVVVRWLLLYVACCSC